MKAAIYARVSTDMQSAASTTDQIREAHRFAALNGWQVVAEHVDDGLSGTDDARPALAALMAEAAAGKFEIIVTESTDRLSRNQWMLPKLVADLKFRDQALVTYDGRYDSRSASSGLLAAVQGYLGAEEREKLIVRTRRGLAGCHDQKLSAGGRAYGYQSVALDPSDPRFDSRNPRRRQAVKVINEGEAKWVRMIFQLRGEGMSLERIAAHLTRENVPPPGAHWRKTRRLCKAWSDSALRGILQNPLYKGLYLWNVTERRRIPGTRRKTTRLRPESEWRRIEAPELRIVDPGLWERVNSGFKASPAAVAAARRGRGPKFPLSGLLACSCGAHYVIGGRDGYRCGAWMANRESCSNGLRFMRRDIEDAVFHAFEQTILTPEAIEQVIKQARQALNVAGPSTSRKVSAEVTKLDREIEELRDMIRSGKVRPELLQPALQAAQAKRQAMTLSADRQAAQLPERVSVAITKGAERVREILRRLRHTSNPMHAKVLRETVRQYLADGEITLAPSGDRLTGTMRLDASAYLVDVPAANNLAPPAGVPIICSVPVDVPARLKRA